jgi:V8-like Glu-specific endopeptidase
MTKKITIITVTSIILLFTIFCLFYTCTEKKSIKQESVKELRSFSGDELYTELQARIKKRKIKSATKDNTLVRINKELARFSDEELYNALWGIYGKDDRKNIYDTTIRNNPSLFEDAQKVACLVDRNQLKKKSKNIYILKENKLFTDIGNIKLCSNEQFYGEPVAAYCSGFAVGKTLFVTAGHCLDSENIKQVAFVYGYYMKDSLNPNLEIKAEDIYYPVRIIGHSLKEDIKNDFCVVKVNRVISANRITNLRREGKISDNESIYTIGYPCGLPLKVTMNGKVVNNSFPNYFVTNLDTYHGNSGSPVFNGTTHMVEGILVRGDSDFKYMPLEGGCNKSAICREDARDCIGEDVSRVIQFHRWVNR